MLRTHPGEAPPVRTGFWKSFPYLHYVIAIGSVTLAMMIRLEFPTTIDSRPLLILFLMPIILSAYMGGLYPGLVATFFAALSSNYFLIPPLYTLWISRAVDIVQWIVLLATGVFVSFLTEALRRARERDRRIIDQLRNAEKRLLHSTEEARELRAALDEHAIVAITDARGKITYVNDKFCAISGYNRDELIGQDHRIINSGFHSKEFFHDLWSTIRGGRVWHGEIQNRAKNGSRYWVDTTLVPFIDAAGHPRQYIAIRADITEKKLGELALRRQQEELQVLFDLNPAMIWFKDTHNNHLRVNKRAADAIGLPVSEIEGRPASRVYPAEAERFYADDLKVIQSRKPKLGIIECIHDAAGRDRWIQTDKVPYFDAEGNVAGIVVSAQDITDRRESERALRESEERFRQLAENINEVFWILDPVRQRILYVSPAYETVWGRSCEKLYVTPRDWLDAVHPEDRPRVEAAMSASLASGDYDETYRVLRPDGTQRWVHDRGFPVRDDQGSIYRLVGTAEDVTENRQLQTQFFQAQKMEAIGTLAGGIAHDFNNILGGIIGYTELARMRTKDDPRTTEYLDAVFQAGRRAVDLVRQILAFSRRQEHQKSVVQLRHLVAESMQLLRATIPTTIEFSLHLAKASPVMADPSQIHQIVLNLCTNAAHAMKDRPGQLEVRLDDCDVDESLAASLPPLRPGPHVRLTVADSGCGMPPSLVNRIFEPFFTTKAPGEGTGLGLSVVHGIMQSHDGAVSVQSQPGVGTRFSLYFPAVPQCDVAGREAASPPPPAGNGECILFVDDETRLASLGQAILGQLGYRVVTCTRPEEALDRIRSAPGSIDLVITDLTMPEMTGMDLARNILQLRPGLPVILMTGYSANLTADYVRTQGIAELLFKPVTMQTLGDAVHRALQKKTGLAGK